MDTTIEAQGTPPRQSTRHLVVDGRFAAILEEDFGIDWGTVLDALVGEPQKAAIALCGWAAEKTDDPAGALVAWAKKHRRGSYRPERPEPSGPSRARDGTSGGRSGTGRATDTPRTVNVLRGALWGAADGLDFDRAGVA